MRVHHYSVIMAGSQFLILFVTTHNAFQSIFFWQSVTDSGVRVEELVRTRASGEQSKSGSINYMLELFKYNTCDLSHFVTDQITQCCKLACTD